MLDIGLVCEADEQWSYVGSKKQQRWLWYIWSTHGKTILAYAFGRRKDQMLKQLLAKVAHLNIAVFHTDDWGAYQRCLPYKKHCISKCYTQNIERQNLNFRTRIKRLARRTICFSKSVEIHDKVVGEFINQCFFQPV